MIDPEAVDRLIALEEADAAARALGDLWRQDQRLASASFIVSRYETLRSRLALVPYRVAVARSFTLEPMVPLVRAAAFASGIDLTIHLGDFNAYAQELLDPASSVYRNEPDAVFLAVQTRDIAPDLWLDYARMTADDREASAAAVISSFRDWVRAHRSHSSTPLIIHTLEEPPLPGLGLLDRQVVRNQSATIQHINEQLRRLASDSFGVHILDYEALVATHGRASWHDEHRWLTARMPIAADHLIDLAREWLRILHPLTGKLAKVVVVDLDRTLWGGILGEDRPSGIQVGPEPPGSGYDAFQRALLDLRSRGILLAICSKNDQDEALEVLTSHPHIRVRPDHFSAMRINWKDKPDNLREIAAELGVGTDALAFVDDDPAERELVRRELPDVVVIDLPADSMGYARALLESPVFERLALSDEDRARGFYYSSQRARAVLHERAPTREDFYRSLQQEVHVAPVTASTIARVAQLTQKTNQFNFTTRRYTAQEIAERAARPGWQIWTARVADRFGDNGIVGVAITSDVGAECEVDTFLLSCRVIARTIETALMSHLLTQARRRRLRRVKGWFRPTTRNTPAASFYKSHGFVPLDTEGDAVLWELDLSTTDVACPPWIRLLELEHEI